MNKHQIKTDFVLGVHVMSLYFLLALMKLEQKMTSVCFHLIFLEIAKRRRYDRH